MYIYKKVKYLLNKSYYYYKHGGIKTLVKKFFLYANYLLNKYVNIKSKLLFNRNFPPIIIKYKDKRHKIGIQDKYILNQDFNSVVPGENDLVVESGVQDGRDTATFAKLSDQVIAFEPSPRNYISAKNNLESFDNIRLLNKGLWNKKEEMRIKYGSEYPDDGFLEPDSGLEKESEIVQVNEISEYMNDFGIEKIDFLKVEAEGAEPEVIQGINDLTVINIVVNAGEERDGKPTGGEVANMLQSKGYSLVGIKWGHILFFTLRTTSESAFRSYFI